MVGDVRVRRRLGPRPRRRQTFARWRQRVRRRWRETKCLAKIVGHELIRTRTLNVAAELSFWSLMSMVPLLMTVVALLSVLRLPTLVPEMLGVLALLVPATSLAMVEKMVGTLLTPHSGALSFGIISYIWASTGGFTSLIAALDIAYDVERERGWLRDRLQAILLTFTSGGLVIVSLLGLILGPHFAHFLAQIFTIPSFLQELWPFIRFGTIFVCFVLALELMYFLGPNRRQHFKSTLPGAILAIFLWFAGSFGLSFYLAHLSNFSRLYGGMGALLALMFWTYLTSLAILIGAETNAEMAKRRDAIFRAHLNAARREKSEAERRPAETPQRNPISGHPAA